MISKTAMHIRQCNVIPQVCCNLAQGRTLLKTTVISLPFRMKTTLQRWSTALCATSISAFVTVSAHAASFAGPDPSISGTPGAGSGDANTYRTIITNILTAVLNFLALIAVVIVVIAGIRLIVSQGEDDAKDKAKKTIFYALIGLVIVLFARVIVGLVTNYLATQVGGSSN